MDSPRNNGGDHGSSRQMVEVDAPPLLSGQPTQTAISEDDKKKLVEENNVSPRELSPPVPPSQVVAAMMADETTKADDDIKQRIKNEMKGGGGVTAKEASKLDDDTQHAPSPAAIRPPAPPSLVAASYEMMRTSAASELNDNDMEIKANAKEASITSPPLHFCKPPTPPSHVAAAYEMMDTSNRGLADAEIKTNAKEASATSSSTPACGEKDNDIKQRIKREMEGADVKEPANNSNEETNKLDDEKDGGAQQHLPSIPPAALPAEYRATSPEDTSAIVTRPPPRSMLPREDTDIELGTEKSDAPMFYALEATAVLDDTVYSATPIIDPVYIYEDTPAPPLPWWKKHRFCLGGGIGLLVGVAVAVVVALLIGTGGDTTTDANSQASARLEPPSVSPSQLLPTAVGITVPPVNKPGSDSASEAPTSALPTSLAVARIVFPQRPDGVMAMSVTSQCTDNGGYPYVVLEEPNDSIDQQFYIQGELIVSGKCPGMSMHILGGGCDNGQRITLRSESHSIPTTQRWIVNHDGTIESKACPGKGMAVYMDTSDDGSRVKDDIVLWGSNGNWNELWEIQEVSICHAGTDCTGGYCYKGKCFSGAPPDDVKGVHTTSWTHPNGNLAYFKFDGAEWVACFGTLTHGERHNIKQYRDGQEIDAGIIIVWNDPTLGYFGRWDDRQNDAKFRYWHTGDVIHTGGDTTIDSNGQASVGLEPPSLNQTTDVAITVESPGNIIDDNEQSSAGLEPPSVSPPQLLPTAVGITVPPVNKPGSDSASEAPTSALPTSLAVARIVFPQRPDGVMAMSVTSQCTDNGGYPYVVLEEPNDSIDQQFYIQGELIVSGKCPGMSMHILGGGCDNGQRIALRSESHSIPTTQRWIVNHDGTIESKACPGKGMAVYMDTSDDGSRVKDDIVLWGSNGNWNELWEIQEVSICHAGTDCTGGYCYKGKCSSGAPPDDVKGVHTTSWTHPNGNLAYFKFDGAEWVACFGTLTHGERHNIKQYRDGQEIDAGIIIVWNDPTLGYFGRWDDRQNDAKFRYWHTGDVIHKAIDK